MTSIAGQTSVGKGGPLSSVGNRLINEFKIVPFMRHGGTFFTLRLGISTSRPLPLLVPHPNAKVIHYFSGREENLGCPGQCHSYGTGKGEMWRWDVCWPDREKRVKLVLSHLLSRNQELLVTMAIKRLA